MERDANIRKIINRAARLFDEGSMDGGGLFATSHYGQAVKAKFKTPAPRCRAGALARARSARIAAADGLAQTHVNTPRRLSSVCCLPPAMGS